MAVVICNGSELRGRISTAVLEERLMHKYRLLAFAASLMLLVARMVAAQETILGDSQSIADLTSIIPKEYQGAFGELKSGSVDELFYKMLVLARGIKKDDRIAIYARWDSTGKEILKGGLRLQLNQAEGLSAPIGAVYVIYSQLPKVLEQGYSGRILLLTRYQGTIENIPLLAVDMAIYTKEVVASSIQKVPALAPDTLLSVADSARRSLPYSVKVLVATDATWPPMEMKDESGQLVGFDIDLMRAIAKAAGFRVEFLNVAWDGIFSGLDAGKYDAIASAVTITDDRSKAMLFSDPYINAGQVLVVSQDLPAVQALSDLRGRTVGAQIGTTGAFEIDKVKDRYGIILKTYDGIDVAFQDLASGVITGLVCDLPVAAQYARLMQEYAGMLKIVGKQLTEEYYGIALKSGSVNLQKAINAGLAKIASSGELKALHEKWFGAER